MSWVLNFPQNSVFLSSSFPALCCYALHMRCDEEIAAPLILRLQKGKISTK